MLERVIVLQSPACNQLVSEEESRLYSHSEHSQTSASVHPNAFSIACAPAKFQKTMETIIQGIYVY